MDRSTAPPPSADPHPSAATGASPVGPAEPQEDRTLAAVAYILTWLTGLIIYFVAKPEQRYARWHAVQAIALGIVVTVLSIAAQVLTAMFAFTVPPLAMLVSLVMGLVALGTLVLVIIGAIKAYQGQPFRLPVLADFADKYADRPQAAPAASTA